MLPLPTMHPTDSGSAPLFAAWRCYLSDPAQALAIAQRELATTSLHGPLAWTHLVMAMAACRNPDCTSAQALEHFKLARQGFAQANDARGLRMASLADAALAFREARWPDAVAAFEQLIGQFDLNQLDPDNFYLCYGLATAYVYCGQLEEGLRFGYAGLHLAQQLHLAAEQVTVSLPLAVALHAATDYEESDAVLRAAEALALDLPGSRLLKTVRTNRISALRCRGRLDEALEMAQAALADPGPMIGGQSFVHLLAAELFIDRHEFDAAKLQVDTAHRLIERGALSNLERLKLHYIQGMLASRLGAVDAAIHHFEAARQLLPQVPALRFSNRADLHEELARALAQKGRFEAAYAEQKRLIAYVRHNLEVVNRVRRFGMQVRFEISRARDHLQSEIEQRQALEAANAQLRQAVSAVSREAQSLRSQADHDPLTGMPNRRALERHLPVLLKQSQLAATPLAIVMIDLDHFKQINDQYGHAMGDRVLRQMAQLLAGAGRSGDVAIRYGGEEFVLALVGCGPSAALGRVRALMQALAQHRFAVDRDSLHSVTFSAGVAVNPEDGQTIEHLLAIADARLYSAKRQGRNRVVAHDMSDQVRELEQA